MPVLSLVYRDLRLKNYMFVDRKSWTGVMDICILKYDMWQRDQRIIPILNTFCFTGCSPCQV